MKDWSVDLVVGRKHLAHKEKREVQKSSEEQNKQAHRVMKATGFRERKSLPSFSLWQAIFISPLLSTLPSDLRSVLLHTRPHTHTRTRTSTM